MNVLNEINMIIGLKFTDLNDDFLVTNLKIFIKQSWSEIQIR